MGAKLIIHKPRLSVVKNVARVNCNITEVDKKGNASKKVVMFDVDKKWRKYLVTENINAYLIGCLPYAMRNKMDIELLAPVSSDLIHGIEMYLVPHLAGYDNRLYEPKIITNKIQYNKLPNAGAVGTGMSMGVDSLFTVHQYADSKFKDYRLSHLLVEQVGDLVSSVTSGSHKRNVNRSTVDEVGKALNLPVVYTYSNFRQLFRMTHYHTHTFTAMFNVHMMAKLFKTYFYSSTEDFSHFSLVNNSTQDAATYELLSLQALSTDSLRLMSGGAASDRIDKTKELANNDIARSFLRVCLVDEANCGKCMKCCRTLLTLDMQDNLDKFNNVFDVSEYKKNRDYCLRWLVKSYHRNRYGISVTELYNFFYSSYPDVMTRLEGEHVHIYESMRAPRKLRAKQDVNKIDPATLKESNESYKKDDQIHFIDKMYINNVCYLRSKEDSESDKNLVVPIDQLTKI